MEWHLNDLSLAGQFTSPAAFRAALEPLLQLRRKRQDLRTRIFCSRSLYLRPVTHALNVQQTVLAVSDPLFKRLALEWFANGGPFWDDARATNPNDYFEYDGEDVTDQGLGESARRRLDEKAAGTFSFPVQRFELTPLTVQHGLKEEPLGHVEVENSWAVADLETFVGGSVDSWAEMMNSARTQLDRLVFSKEIAGQLSPEPFESGMAERILHLLQVLQELATETQDDFSRTSRGMRLYETYFTGKAPAFTDESETNKKDFKSELTFADPSGASGRLFCPWHGKISRRHFRFHFEWPRPLGQREVKVTYIGPKVTKH